MLRSLIAASLLALALAAPAAAASYDDAAYWAFADRMQERIDGYWNERAGSFWFGGHDIEPMANAMQLLTYSVAALHGHQGPARNDERARRLAARLVQSPPFVTERTGSLQTHAPGWVSSMNSPRALQHLVFDAEVVDGLVYAYRARDALGLPPETVAAIRDAIHATARTPFWRYPTVRLNQVNWYALMYAADATVTGSTTLLTRDLHLQLKGFFADARGNADHAGNFGPGLRFHYLPHDTVSARKNVDTAEYANLVLSFVRFYDQARRAGMAPLSPSSKALTQQWIRRAISGYWTHAGYLNWDTGLGFDRWHQLKKFALAQEALVGLAGSDTLLPAPAWGSWAKSLLDSGFGFYERQLRDRIVPDPLLFGVNAVPQAEQSALLAAARIQANAARAVAAGLGRKRGATPPPLYAYDPDIGRLAVTTPAYNTAIVPVNQDAFPYGGLDLARLYDGSQEVAGNIGGRPPASFGLLVRDAGGGRIGATQTPLRRITAGASPLRLLTAPRGVNIASSDAIGQAYAGPFSDLRATGTRRFGRLTVRVTHRFRRDWIQSDWTATHRTGEARLTVDALFPSWRGDGAASVVAVLRGGERVAVGDAPVALSRVAYLWIRSERSGYVVVPRSRPAGAGVHLIAVSGQSSNPLPGPTLAVELAHARRFKRLSFGVRITPARTAEDAAAAAKRLR